MPLAPRAARIRDAWITLANRCEFIEFPDVAEKKRAGPRGEIDMRSGRTRACPRHAACSEQGAPLFSSKCRVNASRSSRSDGCGRLGSLLHGGPTVRCPSVREPEFCGVRFGQVKLT